MKLTKADFDYELDHKYKGNGFAILQMLDDNYCRVVEIPVKNSTPSQAI